jgi:hypothetical protein
MGFNMEQRMLVDMDGEASEKFELMIALITISYQHGQVGAGEPVESLRYE